MDLRRIWLVWFIIFAVISTVSFANNPALNGERWGETTYQVNGATYQDFLDLNETVSLSGSAIISAMGIVQLEREIGNNLVVGVIDESFAKMTPAP